MTDQTHKFSFKARNRMEIENVQTMLERMEDAQQDVFIIAQQVISNKSNLPIEPPSSRKSHKRNHFLNFHPTSVEMERKFTSCQSTANYRRKTRIHSSGSESSSSKALGEQ